MTQKVPRAKQANDYALEELVISSRHKAQQYDVLFYLLQLDPLFIFGEWGPGFVDFTWHPTWRLTAIVMHDSVFFLFPKHAFILRSNAASLSNQNSNFLSSFLRFLNGIIKLCNVKF